MAAAIALCSAQERLYGRLRDPLSWSKGKYVESLEINENYTAGTFKTLLDHFDNNTQSFDLRYWTNDKYFEKKENSPMFIYICGEAICNPPSDKGTAMAFGASQGALLVALEHRYYGASQPFPDWSTENLKYL